MTSVPKVNPGDMVFWHCVCFPSFTFHYSSLSAIHRMLCTPSRKSTPVKKIRQVRSAFLGLWIIPMQTDDFSDVHRRGPADTHEYRVRQETGRDVPRGDQSPRLCQRQAEHRIHWLRRRRGCKGAYCTSCDGTTNPSCVNITVLL